MARSARSLAEPKCVAGALLLCLFAGAGCSRRATAFSQPPIDKNDPSLRDHNGVLERNGTPFSGYMLEQNGAQIVSQTPYLDGKRHGYAYGWHLDGALAYERLYRHGDREGTHHGWWPSGNLQFVYKYEHDLFEGEQLAYYKNGVRAELRHYRRGQEDGRQTLWDGAGQMRSNYTFKEGRRYGIVGSFDCVAVHAQ